MRVMCRLLEPTTGEVTIESRFLPHGRRTPLDFGIVIDGPALMNHHSGWENLSYLASIRSLIGDSEIAQWMDRLGLDPGSREPVRHYSQGMKQRLALAQAMMENQRVLLLDEPFNALDRQGVTDVKELLRDWLEDGVTIVFTSHIDGDVSDLADAVSVVESGTVAPS